MILMQRDNFGIVRDKQRAQKKFLNKESANIRFAGKKSIQKVYNFVDNQKKPLSGKKYLFYIQELYVCW